MPLPKYMNLIEDSSAPEGVKVEVRYWHPSFLKVLWIVLEDKPAFVRPFLVPFYWVKLICRNHIGGIVE